MQAIIVRAVKKRRKLLNRRWLRYRGASSPHPLETVAEKLRALRDLRGCFRQPGLVRVPHELAASFTHARGNSMVGDELLTRHQPPDEVLKKMADIIRLF